MRYKTLFISLGIILSIGVLIYINPNQLFTKLILRLTGYYKTPEYETRASVLSTLKGKGIYYDRLYTLSGATAMEDLKKKKLLHVPFVQIYNRDKDLVSIASGDECKWALLQFVASEDTSKLVASDSLMFQFLMDRLAPVDIRTDQDTFENYIVAGWANFLPMLSNDLFEQTNSMKESLGSKVCLTYINLDHQEGWEEQ